MKNAIIAGATGLTGIELIKLLEADTTYNNIFALTRRALSVSTHKTTLINQPIEIPSETKITTVFCALGTTIKKAGSKDAFRLVDYDMIIELADWAKQRGVIKFVVISSLGANAKSSNFYLKTKGQLESRLKTMGFNTLIIVRPSLLTGNRHEFRIGEKLSKTILSILHPLLLGKLKKYRSIEAWQVAKAMVELANNKENDIFIIESDQLSIF